VEALDKGRVDRLDAGLGVVLDDGREVFLDTGLARLEPGRPPWLFAERLELLEGIMVVS
jgi:hypothetical protein